MGPLVKRGVLERLRAPWAVVAAAGVVAALLLGSALLIRRSVDAAAHLVARGMGNAFAVAGRENFRERAQTPSSAELQEFLEAHREGGLRYLGFHDEEGRPLASAGQALGESMKEGALELIGNRARLVHRVRPARDAVNRPQPRRMVYEFEPLAAQELERQASGLLWVAIVSCAGILAFALAFARTLSQREVMQAELERGRTLAALGSMSAVLAHEVRNPLASLKGHAQLLAETVESDPALRPKVERVVSEATRLERLTNDLLDFVRGGEADLREADPNEILRAAVEAVGAPVRPELLPGRPSWLLDSGRLRQALENVLRNAAQADGREQPIEARVAIEGDWLVYSVRDDGRGIAEGEEERIFEPFVTDRVRGVGLGLAVTRRIVEQHGGTVSARNHPSGGAELRIALPRRKA